MGLDPCTGDVNGGEGNCHGDDDGSSSHFQKTVCLYDWWLTMSEKESKGESLAIGGSTSTGTGPVRLFTSAPITKRYDAFTMETADGVCVVLQGFINKPRTEENGFSSEIFNHFVYGFPRHWEECYQSCLGKEINKGTELGGVTDLAMPSTGLAEPSLSSCSSKDKEAFGEDKHNCDNNVDSSGIVAEDINVAASEGSFEKSSRNDKVETSLLNVAEQITVNANRGSDRQCLMPNLSNVVEERLDASKSEREADKATISPRAGNRKGRKVLREKKSIQKNNHEDGCGITFDADGGSESQSHMANLSSVVEESLGVSQSERGVNKASISPRATCHMPNLSNGVEDTLDDSKPEREADKESTSPHAGTRKSRKVLRNTRSNQKNNHKDGCGITCDDNRGSESQSHMANLSSVVEESLDVSQSEREVSKASISQRAKNSKLRRSLRYSSKTKNPTDSCSMTTKDQKLTPKTSKPLDPKTLKKNSPCKETDNEDGYVSRETLRRKINFDTQANPSTPERKGNQSIISPESLSCKRSRSGRLILPPLDYWRNQVALYDEDRNITGIQQEENPVNLSGTGVEHKRKKK